MQDNSLRHMKDGRTFQMRSVFTGKPIPFRDGKHNYRKKDYDLLDVGECMTFMPMYGNVKPVYTRLIRLV